MRLNLTWPELRDPVWVWMTPVTVWPGSMVPRSTERLVWRSVTVTFMAFWGWSGSVLEKVTAMVASLSTQAALADCWVRQA